MKRVIVKRMAASVTGAVMAGFLAAGLWTIDTCAASDSEAAVLSGDYGFVYDEEDLLTDDEEEELWEKLERVGRDHDIQIAVVTVSEYEQSSMRDFADDMMDYGELGMRQGDDDSAILLAVNMDERNITDSTRGEAIRIFNDRALTDMEDEIIPYLKDGDYAEGFNVFAETCDNLCTRYEESGGDEDYYAKTEPVPAWKWLVCVGLGLACGGVPVGVMASGMKSVKMNNSAAEYERKDQVRIMNQYDRFIRKSVSRVRKQESSSSGGSRTHTSSSGHSHGGHSRSF